MAEPGTNGNSDVDPEQLERDGAMFAQKAVAFDQSTQYQVAIFFYTVRHLCFFSQQLLQTYGHCETLLKMYLQEITYLKNTSHIIS